MFESTLIDLLDQAWRVMEGGSMAACISPTWTGWNA
jgi:hypothetical protein